MSPLWSMSKLFSRQDRRALASAKAGRVSRGSQRKRPLTLEPLEDRSLLTITLGFDTTPFQVDATTKNLQVNYTIADGSTTGAFDVKLIATDNSSNNYELMSKTVSGGQSPGSYSTSFTGSLNYASSGDVMKDYSLKVVIDPAGTSGRTNSAPENTYAGVFKDNSGVVEVQGTSADETVTASVSGSTLNVVVTTGGTPTTTSLSNSSVSAIHVRTRTGNDTVSVAGNSAKTFWGFAGSSGTQTITGGSGTNTIFGGGGTNTLNSGKGNATITAGTGSNTIFAETVTEEGEGGEPDNDVSPNVSISINDGAGTTSITGNTRTTLNLNYLTGDHTETVGKTQATIDGNTVTYSGGISSAINVTGGTGSDAITVELPSSGALPTFTVNLGTGGGTDTLTVLGTSAADTIGISTASGISGNSSTISHSNAESVVLDGGAGNDSFNITEPASGSLPALTIAGNSNTDTLTLGLLTSTATVYSDHITLSANPTINYSGLENITVNGTSSANTVNISVPSAATPFPSLTVALGSGTDTLNLTAESTSANTVSISSGSATFNTKTVSYSGVDTLSATGNSGADAFTITEPSSGSLPNLAITGGTGNDTATLTTNVGNNSATSTFDLNVDDVTLTNLAVNRTYDVRDNDAASGTASDLTLSGTLLVPTGVTLDPEAANVAVHNLSALTLHGGFSNGNWDNINTSASEDSGITNNSKTFYVNYDNDVVLLEESFSGGVQVTTSLITTELDRIPRFGASPTVKSIASGNWSDGSTWSTGSVPTTDDVVKVSAGTTVTYNANDDTHAIKAIEVAGTLQFATGINTELLVATVQVLPIGTLKIGTGAGPIASDKIAKLTFADQAFSTSTSSNPDPSQYGVGLLSFGDTTMHGSEVAETWVRLAAEVDAEDDTLLVNGDFSDWQEWDRLMLPDTRQPANGQDWQFLNYAMSPVSEWEVVEVDYVDYNSGTGQSTIHLKSGTQYEHVGPRGHTGSVVTIHDDEDLFPHVARLTRNVIVSSENPAGTRGHTLFGGRGFADLEYADFKDLGRTDALAGASGTNPHGGIDNTIYDDSSGAPTSIGENQVGRYAVHFHHVLGPWNDPSDPDMEAVQFQFIGNTVESFKKWGVAVHESSWGLLRDNVVYDGQGSGFVTEEGNEINNVFDHNITTALNGTFFDGKEGLEVEVEIDYGRGGNGFWFRRGGNIVTGNVAADSTYAGLNIDGYFPEELTLPDFPGAYISDPSQSTTSDYGPGNALHTFEDNEAYGMSMFGMWGTYLQGDVHIGDSPDTVFSDFRAWHLFNAGIWLYYTENVTFDGLLLVNDPGKWDRNDGGAVGLRLTHYFNINAHVTDATIDNFPVGFYAPQGDGSEIGRPQPTVIENSSLSNYSDIVVTPPEDGVNFGGNWLEVNDVLFPTNTVLSLPAGPLNPATLPDTSNIRMLYTGVSSAERYDYTRPSIVMVNDYNGTTDDFEVFYTEQAHDAVMIESDPDEWFTRSVHTTGAPPGANITNEDAWDTLGYATLGVVAPEDAVDDYDGIIGLVGEQHIFAGDTRRAALATPIDDSVFPFQYSGYVPIRYSMQGLLGEDEWIWMVRDEGTANEIFTQFPTTDNAPVAWVAAPGHHTLRAFIGDESHNQIVGTEDTEVEFDIRGFSIDSVTHAEGNSGTTQFVFTVTLSYAINQQVTVQYATADFSASSSSDYTATSGTLTFAANQTTATITVLVSGDTTDESNEQFKVLLSNSDSLEVPIGVSLGWGNITDDD